MHVAIRILGNFGSKTKSQNGHEWSKSLQHCHSGDGSEAENKKASKIQMTVLLTAASDSYLTCKLIGVHLTC
eukprot:m.90422 g.90422  ORF g.90422 m.90422 type:complete len:72 (+) comp13266_c0_seq2:2116-2331(+)